MTRTMHTIHDRPCKDVLDLANILDFYFGRECANSFLLEMKREDRLLVEYYPKTPSASLLSSFFFNHSYKGEKYWYSIKDKLKELEDSVTSDAKTT
jgi:hypothetical protein